ncbi:MAG TPA: TorF family putative porin [Gammaproteobacteria bacterium]|nr:TorF family putative porin [Gammaproteobacteria bacterium]
MNDFRIRRGLLAGVAAIGVALANASAQAQRAPSSLHGSVTLSSEYMQNGLAHTHDEPSLSVSLDFEHQSGFFVGGAVANVDYIAESQFGKPRDTAANVYAGYLWRRNQWMVNSSVARYQYPDIERSYDYTQATANVAFRDRYFFTVSRTGDYLSIYDSAEVYRAGVALPWLRNIEFGVNAGRFSADGSFDTSYTFWDAGLSRSIGRFALDLRYHDNTYGFSSLLGNDASNLWVLSLTYPFLPIAGRDR